MAVLCLHSSQSSGAQWRPLLSLFEGMTEEPVFMPDLLGYGRSDVALPVPVADFRLQYEEKALQQILTEFDGKPLHLVGHSYGGALALRLARQLSERDLPPLSLSLYEPVAFHILAADDPARQEIDEVALRMDELFLTDAAAAFVDYWNHPGYFSALPERVQKGMIARQTKVQADFAALLYEPAQLDDYRCIQCPVLLMDGAQSPQSSRRVASLLRSVWPQVQYQQINAGHMAPLTHPQLALPPIKSFIQFNSKVY